MSYEENEQQSLPAADPATAPVQAHASLFGGWGWRRTLLLLVVAGFTGVLLVAMRNYSTKQWKRERDLEGQLDALRAQSVLLNAELMKASQEEEVIRMVQAKNLQLVRPSEPARVIPLVGE